MDLTTKEQPAIVPMGTDSLFFNEAKFALAEKVAGIFAGSTMVPEHFQENIGNCLIALNYASRINADPFMLMQNMYIVYGRPGLEGKLVIALVNQCGRFEPLEFVEDEGLCDGKKENGLGCIARAREMKSGKVLEGVKIDWAMVKAEGWLGKKGSKWMTMPQQMFRYRSAAFFARAYCPEVLLGMQTREELQDITDLARGADGTYATGEDLKGKTQDKIDALKERDTSLDRQHEKNLEYRRVVAAADSLAKLAAKKVAEGQPTIEKPITGEQLDAAVGSAHDADDPEAKIWDEKYWKDRRTGNGKTTGFASYINSRLDELQHAPAEVMARLITKWYSHYKAPFPTLKPLNPGQDKDEDPKTAHSSSEPPPDDGPPPWETGENEGEGKSSTINRTGFPEIDQALDALGPDGPEIYDRAKNNVGYPNGAHTTEMAVEIATEMSAIVDREGSR